MSHPDDLALAQALADRADALTMARFGAADLRVDTKPDLTPVSDADLDVERAIRTMLAQQRPADAVIGEEYPDEHAGAYRRWVIDPIDGTKNFVRGVPVWATLIALFEGDSAVVGVASAPALARRWWARAGAGAFTAFAGGPQTRCRVSAVGGLADASLSLSDLAEWAAAGKLGPVLDLTRTCWRTRGYGDFFSYVLVAQGAVDVAAEPELNLWDLAALVPIVTEAGGVFTTVDGTPIGPGSTSALATNGLLHPAALAALTR